MFCARAMCAKRLTDDAIKLEFQDGKKFINPTFCSFQHLILWLNEPSTQWLKNERGLDKS